VKLVFRGHAHPDGKVGHHIGIAFLHPFGTSVKRAPVLAEPLIAGAPVLVALHRVHGIRTSGSQRRSPGAGACMESSCCDVLLGVHPLAWLSAGFNPAQKLPVQGGQNQKLQWSAELVCSKRAPARHDMLAVGTADGRLRVVDLDSGRDIFFAQIASEAAAAAHAVAQHGAEVNPSPSPHCGAAAVAVAPCIAFETECPVSRYGQWQCLPTVE
jgi:hypothetical protein